MRKKIVRLLENYNINMASIQMCDQEIASYEEIVKADDIRLYSYIMREDVLGMPRASNYKKSQVENQVIHGLTKEIVEEWILKVKSEKLVYKHELDTIDALLNILPINQRKILEYLYINGSIENSTKCGFISQNITHAEIGKLLGGFSADNVYINMKQAIDKMVEVYEKRLKRAN